MCYGAEQSGGDDEGDSEAFHTVAEEATDPLSRDRWRNEQSRNKEHKRHEEDVVPAHKGIEQGEANCIHYRRCGFRVTRWIVMAESVVGQCGVMGDYSHCHTAAQIVDRNIPFQSVSPSFNWNVRWQSG